MQAVGSQRKRKAERCQERELEYWDRDIIKIRRENRILSDISNSQADPGEEDRLGVPANNNKYDCGKCTIKE